MISLMNTISTDTFNPKNGCNINIQIELLSPCKTLKNYQIIIHYASIVVGTQKN